MIEIKVYQSADGKRFDSKAECEAHERQTAVLKARNDYCEISRRIAFLRRELHKSDEGYKTPIGKVKQIGGFE